MVLLVTQVIAISSANILLLLSVRWQSLSHAPRCFCFQIWWQQDQIDAHCVGLKLYTLREQCSITWFLLLFPYSDSEKASSLTEAVPVKKHNSMYLTLPDAHDTDSGKINIINPTYDSLNPDRFLFKGRWTSAISYHIWLHGNITNLNHEGSCTLIQSWRTILSHFSGPPKFLLKQAGANAGSRFFTEFVFPFELRCSCYILKIHVLFFFQRHRMLFGQTDLVSWAPQLLF